MPLAWIYNLPREDAEKLAIEFGVSVQGTLDEMWNKLKENWRVVETYLPPQSTDKSEVGMGIAGASDVKFQCSDIHPHVNYSQIKFRGKVVTYLVWNIPVLSDSEPESVFKFLVRAREIYDLNLVTDKEFLAFLVSRMTGRVMQIIRVHLRASSGWGLVCSEILSIFLPPHIQEGFLSRYVLNRFQAATEELSQFVISVVTATNILKYQAPESGLVHRIVQKIHPQVCSCLVFASEPKSLKELYSLASQVAESQATDDRREHSTQNAPN
ncbi:hypothetical protein B7P43_G17550 [Cryptotermes secundus]|uniref:Uncharacterized protein n=1 Tax=Cryptotermes secundus TaxID=105785 RepID=A0A2J7R042_9NEOP|nr:hypothetical protein B7P43_G17550 [Cryptotermes secundus]